MHRTVGPIAALIRLASGVHVGGRFPGGLSFSHPTEKERIMRLKLVRISSAAVAALAAFSLSRAADAALEGVVTSSHGPEAGVWVIAETHELPTKYVKIVVTDDNGRYVLPELPA